MTAPRKAPYFDIEERPCHQCGFSPPSIDHGDLAIGLVVPPDRHDREARRDYEDRRVKRHAHSPMLFRPQQSEGLRVDWPCVLGEAGFAPRHLELSDVSGNAVDLYFGPRAPKGREGRWIKTIPGSGWFAYFRIYGPQPPAFDGSWKPGDFELMG